MKHLRLFEEKAKWHDSDAPDAEGRFKDLSPKELASWLIKTRKKDLKKITGSLNQQIVFNRNDDPNYAEKMEKTRKEVYKQLGRKDLLESLNEGKKAELNLKGRELKDKNDDIRDKVKDIKKDIRDEENPVKNELLALKLQQYILQAELNILKMKQLKIQRNLL
jgi:hypothetical protein